MTTKTTERRCEHTLYIGDYPKQCPKCMKLVLDANSFLGGDRRKSKTTNANAAVAIREALQPSYNLLRERAEISKRMPLTDKDLAELSRINRKLGVLS